MTLDPLLIQKIQTAITTNHRLLLITPTTYHIPSLYTTLAQHTIGARPTVVWLHTDESKKKPNKTSKCKENITSDEDVQKILHNLNADLITIPFSNTARILGTTISMLVIYDTALMQANILARTVETVRGGGLVVMVTNRYRNGDDFQSSGVEKSRYGQRMWKSLARNDDIVFLNENSEIVKRRKNKKIKNITNEEELNNAIINNTTDTLINTKKICITATDINNLESQFQSLHSLTITTDQHNLVQSLTTHFTDHTCKSLISITSPRGRGKSAALGLAISLALHTGLSKIIVTAPRIENVSTLFEFIMMGLKTLGYSENIHYNVKRVQVGRKRLVYSVVLHKKFIQSVEFLDINAYKDYRYIPDLLVVDEAACFPVDVLRAMRGQLIFMASTVHGYEGTGNALTLKFITELKKNSNTKKNKIEDSFIFREYKLDEPIRYAKHDPVEQWLVSTLLLGVVPPRLGCFPSTDSAMLYLVDRQALFSYNKSSELFLCNLASLFIASHYKNTPDDLKIMCDEKNHLIYALMSGVEDGNPIVLCAIHVALEGRTERQNSDQNYGKEELLSKEGNLIPWTVSENYLCNEFRNLTGLRIVRIAVHPDHTGMGYGTRALDLLIKFYMNKKCDIEENVINKENNNNLENTSNTKENFQNNEKTYDYENGSALLHSLDSIKPTHTNYIGTSFGVTPQLLSFWKKNGFRPVYISQNPSKVTGEFSTIMIHEDSSTSNENFSYDDLYEAYKKRFFRLLGRSYRNLSGVLCLSLFYYKGCNSPSDNIMKNTRKDNNMLEFNDYDKKRIESYCRGRSDIRVIEDLFALLAEVYFLGTARIELSVLQHTVLMMVGCQFKSFGDVAGELGIELSMVASVLNKTITKIHLAINKK